MMYDDRSPSLSPFFFSFTSLGFLDGIFVGDWNCAGASDGMDAGIGAGKSDTCWPCTLRWLPSGRAWGNADEVARKSSALDTSAS